MSDETQKAVETFAQWTWQEDLGIPPHVFQKMVGHLMKPYDPDPHGFISSGYLDRYKAIVDSGRRPPSV